MTIPVQEVVFIFIYFLSAAGAGEVDYGNNWSHRTALAAIGIENLSGARYSGSIIGWGTSGVGGG